MLNPVNLGSESQKLLSCFMYGGDKPTRVNKQASIQLVKFTCLLQIMHHTTASMLLTIQLVIKCKTIGLLMLLHFAVVLNFLFLQRSFVVPSFVIECQHYCQGLISEYYAIQQMDKSQSGSTTTAALRQRNWCAPHVKFTLITANRCVT